MFSDISLRTLDDGNAGECTLSLRVLADIARNEPTRIISALECPMIAVQDQDFPLNRYALHFPDNEQSMSYISSALSTDRAAWVGTLGSPGFGLELYPMLDMCWGIAQTKNASSWLHVDANGLGTALTGKCGAKAWFLGKFKDKYRTSYAGVFDAWVEHGSNTSWLDFEVVILDPSQTLYVSQFIQIVRRLPYILHTVI